jgi:hypothetical protein
MTDLEIKQAEIADKMEKTKVEKLSILKSLIEAEIPAENQIGCDYTKRKSPFDESELQTLKDRVFKIVATL